MDEAIASRISEYRRIIAFRNILIHGYSEVDPRRAKHGFRNAVGSARVVSKP